MQIYVHFLETSWSVSQQITELSEINATLEFFSEARWLGCWKSPLTQCLGVSGNFFLICKWNAVIWGHLNYSCHTNMRQFLASWSWGRQHSFTYPHTWVHSKYCDNTLLIDCKRLFFVVKVRKCWIFRDHKAHSIASHQHNLLFVLIGSRQKQVTCKLLPYWAGVCVMLHNIYRVGQKCKPLLISRGLLFWPPCIYMYIVFWTLRHCLESKCNSAL